MKKILSVISLLSCLSFYAQELSYQDALRYSFDDIQGTSRFRAMGGAFGALGGDMSAVSINPASSVVFNTSHASISLDVNSLKNDVDYFGTVNTNNDTDINLNQAGAAFIFVNSNPNSKWNKFSFSLAYDIANNYENNWIAQGTNTNNSIADYFLGYAQGLRLDEISALPGESLSNAYDDIGSVFGFSHQQAFLGYEAFVIDPALNNDDNTFYNSTIQGNSFDQRFIYAANGYNGKLAINLATQYDSKLSLGINLNAHFIDYTRSTLFTESNTNTNSTTDFVDFRNDLYTTGAGFSVQLGAIYNVTNNLRAGFSYNTPTWYRITEESSQYLASREAGTNNVDIVNPNVINIYPEYRLQTPGKITGSLAYVFGKRGILSLDYSLKDYSGITFRPTSDPFFAQENRNIENLLGQAATLRIGGEYKIKQLSLRAGYVNEESPFQDNPLYGDLQRYSAGLGYNFGDLKLDLSLAQTQRDTSFQLFQVGLTDSPAIDTNRTDVTLTIAYSL